MSSLSARALYWQIAWFEPEQPNTRCYTNIAVAHTTGFPGGACTEKMARDIGEHLKHMGKIEVTVNLVATVL